MTKLVGAILLMMSSTALGAVTSRKLILRVHFLQQYLHFVSYIETEIQYTHRILHEIITHYHTEAELNTFLNSVCNALDHKTEFSQAWSAAVNKLPSTYGLLPSDKELLSAFGNELGATNLDGQITLCQLNKNLIKSALEAAIEEKNKKSKLYFMLGSSVGTCLAIMLL